MDTRRRPCGGPCGGGAGLTGVGREVPRVYRALDAAVAGAAWLDATLGDASRGR